MVDELQRAGVPVAAFLPTRVPRLFQYANLRNHRKIMVVDGRVGFTGGMNIRAGHWRARQPADAAALRALPCRRPGGGRHAAGVRRPTGRSRPASGWRATPGSRRWRPAGRSRRAACRTAPTTTSTTCRSCCSVRWRWPRGACASRRRISCPTTGCCARCRSRRCAVSRWTSLLPERSNVPLMDWAMTPQLPWLLEAGCRVSPHPRAVRPQQAVRGGRRRGRWSARPTGTRAACASTSSTTSSATTARWRRGSTPSSTTRSPTRAR